MNLMTTVRNLGAHILDALLRRRESASTSLAPIARPGRIGTVFMLSLVLAGCAGGANDDGFPDPHDAYMKSGTLESSRAIKTVRPGMTKDQVRDLLGRPHFAEGLFNVRTWNYLFDLGSPDARHAMMCQFQLMFDRAMRVEKTQWRTARCATRYSAIQVEPIESDGHQAQHFHLPIADSFAADGSLTADGRQVLEEFVQVIQRDFHAPAMLIGSDSRPERYHAQRQAVERFLSSRDGISGDQVSTTPDVMASCSGSRCAGVDPVGQVVIEIRER